MELFSPTSSLCIVPLPMSIIATCSSETKTNYALLFGLNLESSTIVGDNVTIFPIFPLSNLNPILSHNLIIDRSYLSDILSFDLICDKRYLILSYLYHALTTCRTCIHHAFPSIYTLPLLVAIP